ncbi:hypothetical protein [Cytobacillus oceanisediminis]|uniref:hypothetical protein n=1 Tax=Cytobacillus oceanisediminis TaxID=665099 RepID=UPI00203DD3CC|nr:hypothetical protein [Cytobacillus oceanisediminis]MCM3393141.1 hypothetical protein [Cytobacillus oceanisediminis]
MGESIVLERKSTSHKLTVYDDILPVPLLEKITEFIQGKGEKIALHNKTYWYSFNNEDSPIAEIIDYLKPLIQNMVSEEIVGAEWWVNYKHKSKMGHIIHRDIDDKLYFKTGEIKRPNFGSVLYFGQEEGLSGNLVVFTSPFSRTPLYIPPEPNRFVVFDAGNLPHGVTDEFGQIIDDKSEKDIKNIENLSDLNDIRISLPINWWCEQLTDPDKFNL